MENFFPNLEALQLWSTGLSTLTGDELVPWVNLFWFQLYYSPRFERIPGNLFDSTPLMKHIGFHANNIKHVGENFLSNQPNLIFLSFGRNYCVNQTAYNNYTEIQSLP